MAETKPPKVFISYAWEDELKTWVLDFATRLRLDGINAILDQWETVAGDQLPEFMEKSVRESDFVVFVCTPTYKRKSDRRKGGVGYEGHIITGEIFAKNNHRKFIPVLRKGKWASAAPSWATSKLYIDLRGDPYSEASYQQLLNTLFGKSPTAPPVRDNTLREGSEHEIANEAQREKVEQNVAKRTAPITWKPTDALQDGKPYISIDITSKENRFINCYSYIKSLKLNGIVRNDIKNEIVKHTTRVSWSGGSGDDGIKHFDPIGFGKLNLASLNTTDFIRSPLQFETAKGPQLKDSDGNLLPLGKYTIELGLACSADGIDFPEIPIKIGLEYFEEYDYYEDVRIKGGKTIRKVLRLLEIEPLESVSESKTPEAVEPTAKSAVHQAIKQNKTLDTNRYITPAGLISPGKSNAFEQININSNSVIKVGETRKEGLLSEEVKRPVKKSTTDAAKPNPRRKWNVVTIVEAIASVATICACLIALYSVLPLKDWLSATPIATNTSIFPSATIAIMNTPLAMTSTLTLTPTIPDLKMYVTNGEGNGGVAVVNTASNSIIATISTGATAHGITINNDRTIAYSADFSTNQISVIDLVTNSVVTTIPVGQDPGTPVINHAGDRLYVTNYASSTVSVIDTRTNKVVDTIINVSSPWGVAISPDDSYIAVTLYWNDAVSIFDVKSLQLIATVKVESHPQGVIYLPDNSKLYVANLSSSSISVIDTKTNSVIQTIKSGSNNGNNPTQFALSVDATKLYIPNIDSDTVSEIDVMSGTVDRIINVGDAPGDVTIIFPYLYVTNSVSNSISIVDLNTGETIAMINGFTHPNAIAP